MSEATKKTAVGTETFSYVGKWDVEEALKSVISGDKGLVAKTKAAHHGISAPFESPIDFSEKPLVVQYEVKYQDGGNCGGGYIKLLEDGFQTSGKEFDDKTPWTIMFGPDLTCPGTKVRFRVRYLHEPITNHPLSDSLHLPPQEPDYGRIRRETPQAASDTFNPEDLKSLHAPSIVCCIIIISFP